MNKFLEILKVCFTAIGGWLGFYLGSVDAFIYTLLAFVIADYLTGVLRAGVERKLSSSIGFKGIAKKIMIFIFQLSIIYDIYINKTQCITNISILISEMFT